MGHENLATVGVHENCPFSAVDRSRVLGGATNEHMVKSCINMECRSSNSHVTEGQSVIARPDPGFRVTPVSVTRISAISALF
jgi:hypothetical protein